MTQHHKVFIYCDDESHPSRRVAVTNFLRHPSSAALGLAEGWSEQVSSRAPERPGVGRQMLRDEPAPDGWALDPDNTSADTRVRYQLTCRTCRRPVVARREVLHAVLDKWSQLGVSEVSLAQLGASLQRHKPESGQG